MSSEIDEIINDDAKLQEVVDFCFKDADADGNGTIDAAEFKKHLEMVYSDIGISMPNEDEITGYMSALDINHDGKLDKSEFKAYVVDMLKRDKANRK